MKQYDKNQEQYIDLLCRAIQLFYKNDAKVLFDQPHETNKSEATGDGKIVNERAMVGCVYRYMWCLMQQRISEIPESDIDVEYDRMVRGGSEYYEKEISGSCGERSCGLYSNCIQVIVSELNRRRKQGNSNADSGDTTDVIKTAVRPDIIVHNRNQIGQPNNGLVVEFKKEHKKFCAKDIKFDMAKLNYFTCQDEHTQFHYKVGAMVVLRSEYADVGVISGKSVLCGYRVCAGGKEKVCDREIKSALIRKSSCVPTGLPCCLVNS